MDFEARLEPIRPEYERQAILTKAIREDPVTGVSISRTTILLTHFVFLNLDQRTKHTY